MGDGVGYQIRFDRCLCENTKIVYLTEGVLLRKLLAGDELQEAGAVILDEFHERTVNVDLCLSLIKSLQEGPRPELKLIVSSATLSPQPLIEYLGGCKLIETDGRTFPVKTEYAADGGFQATPIWDRVCKHIGNLTAKEPTGDLLVFLPGAFEIRRVIESLQRFPAQRAYVSCLSTETCRQTRRTTP